MKQGSLRKLIPLFGILLFSPPSNAKAEDEIDFQKMIQPSPASAKFIDKDYFIWCGTMVRDQAGTCHLFYSRWPRKLGHNALVTHSEIAHAVADHPLGPYKHVNVALERRTADHWDGLCLHNPTVHEFDGKYYLYYMGNTGDAKEMKTLNWSHRNHQRIGVAVATSPNGPWKRMDHPLIDVGANPSDSDSLCVSNPSVMRRKDGKFIMVYKAVGQKNPLPFGGPVVHRVAIADSPTGPFAKQPHAVFTAEGHAFPAEDPFIWWQADRAWAIVRDFRGVFNGTGKNSMPLFTSTDGIHWQPAKHPLVSLTQVRWQDGTVQHLNRLERPQLWFENGKPKVLFCAADDTGKEIHSFNLAIPLVPAP